MAATSAETASSSGTKPEQKSGRSRRQERTPTVLDHDVDKPQVTQPGDAPHDTLDPHERASSVTPDKGAAARAGHGVVNAVVPLPDPEVEERDAGEDRIDTYKVTGPDGKLVTVRHNLDTGETERA